MSALIRRERKFLVRDETSGDSCSLRDLPRARAAVRSIDHSEFGFIDQKGGGVFLDKGNSQRRDWAMKSRSERRTRAREIANNKAEPMAMRRRWRNGNGDVKSRCRWDKSRRNIGGFNIPPRNPAARQESSRSVSFPFEGILDESERRTPRSETRTMRTACCACVCVFISRNHGDSFNLARQTITGSSAAASTHRSRRPARIRRIRVMTANRGIPRIAISRVADAESDRMNITAITSALLTTVTVALITLLV